MHDVVIIGAGPVGLACGIEARRHNLDAVIIEKGSLVNSLLGYPTQMEFFSTPELMEIGDHPFPTNGYKPTREEGIEYYRRVAAVEELDIRLYETVDDVQGTEGAFNVATSNSQYKCRNVVVATGFFDIPNLLNVPGEDLPKVRHYYREPYSYSRQKVAVIGAKNSAARAALDCYRHGAEVTLIVRGQTLSDSIKYWIRPDLENRIREGSIKAFFSAEISKITDTHIAFVTPDGTHEIENDWVLAMTGYRPDYSFLESIGITTSDDQYCTPNFDPHTFETERSGVYLAGTVCGGLRTGRWFIENGRFHAQQIMDHIATGSVTPVDFDSVQWKTAE